MKKYMLLLGIMFVWAATFACAPTNPLPQPRRVVDPSQVQDAVKTPQWDMAAIKYQHSGKGLNYQKADLEPVFLVFKNIGSNQPRVLVEDVRGIGEDGDYLAYSTDEAVRLVLPRKHLSRRLKMLSSPAVWAQFLVAAWGPLCPCSQEITCW